jgi:carbon-monoxide dehydrogenase small subunit
MAARSLLDETPHPTRAEIVRWMSGNLCRCTGYEQIVRSVERAAAGART